MNDAWSVAQVVGPYGATFVLFFVLRWFMDKSERVQRYQANATRLMATAILRWLEHEAPGRASDLSKQLDSLNGEMADD